MSRTSTALLRPRTVLSVLSLAGPCACSFDWSTTPSGAGDAGTATDGGDGSSAPGDGDAGDAPVSPLSLSVFTPSGLTDAAEVTLRGVALEGDRPPAALVVDGTRVAVQPTGAWSAVVPIRPGANPIEVRASGRTGAERERTVSFTRDVLWTSLGDQVRNGSSLYVLDGAGESLFEISLSSGDRKLVSGAGRGNGPKLTQARALAYGPALYVGASSLLRIEPASGDRTELSALSLAPLAYNPLAGKLVGLDPNYRCREVSPEDGLASNAVASDLLDFAYFSASSPGYGLNRTGVDYSVVEVDGCSVGATVSNGGNDALGPRLEAPSSIAAGSIARQYVVDTASKALIQVDGTSGARAVLSDATHGAGPAFEEPASVFVDQVDAPYVVDAVLNAIVRVDPQTGDRTVLTRLSRGEGPVPRSPEGIARRDEARALVSDTTLSAILEVDLASGDRKVLSGPGVGEGPEPVYPSRLDMEPGGTSVLVADSGARVIFRVDLDTGRRTVVSGADVGIGPLTTFDLFQTMAFDRAAGRLYVADNQTIVAVALESGDRTVISSAEFGSGPPLSILDMALDAEGGRILVLSGDEPQVVEVDLASGERRPLLQTSALLGNPRVIFFREETKQTYALDANDGVIELDLSAQTATQIAPIRGENLGPALADLTTYGFESARGLAWVWGSAGLIAVDLTSGERQIVSR